MTEHRPSTRSPTQAGAKESRLRDQRVPPSRVHRRQPIAEAPWLPHEYVPRHALWSRLDGAEGCAVTMVVAPAGAGKSLGVAGWLQSSPVREHATWVNADKSLGPREIDDVLATVQRHGQSPGAVIIDDAHDLPSATVRHIDTLLHDTPGSIRIILLTRWDLALSRLMPELLGHLTVLRGEVLRLNEEEATQLIATHAHNKSSALRKAIIEKADGWCAALVLAARASAAAPSEAEFVERCRSAGPGAGDLVAGEAFASLHPRERHLILCAASESTVTKEEAKRLTRDAGAGDVLARLESTGLLVTRVSTGGDEHQDYDARFRFHPLLVELARRRLVAGGVDVQQAHATVLRATMLELAQGRIEHSYRKLLSLHEYATAVRVFVDHGPALSASTGGEVVRALLSEAGPTVEQHPEAWPTVALSFWMLDDRKSAEYWARRAIRSWEADASSMNEVAAAVMRLRLSRGRPSAVEGAVQAARALWITPDDGPARNPFFTLLWLELGVAENWLGDLVEAQTHLSKAVTSSATEDLAPVTSEAASHLALNQYMLGRSWVCAELVRQAVTSRTQDALSRGACARAALVSGLIEAESLPWGPAADDLSALPSTPDDLAGDFWRLMLEGRVCLLQGRVTEALELLDQPSLTESLTPHLRIVLLLQRASLGMAAGDRGVLRRVADEFRSLEAPGELAWVEGAALDLAGGLRAAVDRYVEAGGVPWRTATTTAEVALVAAAQLCHYLGDATAAALLMNTALAATQERRYATPFLGWSAHGTRVADVMTSMGAVDSTWAEAIRDASADRASVTWMMRAGVPAESELGSWAERRPTVSLSPRERDVLNELARGSTYADISAALFVSENTVKTHVSSLYAKLSVSRRREALAVARKQHLL